ncbi:U3 snoRNP-associated protein Rrp5 [Obba rivulosa]|uniref:U3 snoRNP-associated protein Rrp5 n=1 Tax=Obba rivulosa TaxID=1052685 RepID=A0A8E2DS14_9APHY|nr:U3 snoRNP-associated protein Rrp5 [Obba rivulosa]
MAGGKKRVLDEDSGLRKTKKVKTDDNTKKSKAPENAVESNIHGAPEEVDFPRGGGTSLTPLEVKTLRAEAVQEANQELFEDADAVTKPAKRSGRKSDVSGKERKTPKERKGEAIRVEHLNYKRVEVGMKVLAQVISVEPLALIVSLPNQLFAHVPITQISSELTERLERMGEEDEDSVDEEAEENGSARVPDLLDLFKPGQYIRAVVTAVHAPGSTDVSGLGRARDEAQKASRRVELSIVPEKVNGAVAKADVRQGSTFTAAIKSVEDHGYILNLGVPEISGFLSFKDATKGYPQNGAKLHVGQILDISVTKVASNGRTCTVTVDPREFHSSSISEISSVTSVLPGTLVQSLITAVVPDGLNLQILGYFGGTVDQFHLLTGDTEENYKVGTKVKARVLYDLHQSSPPRFALSLAEHVLSLSPKRAGGSRDDDGSILPDAYPVGCTLDAVEVIRVESERGLIVRVSPEVEGFVHISQVSDDHVPSLSLSSGSWKKGTTHKARVTGYFPLDGILQLSLRPSVLTQKFLQVGEVQVGEVIKGTVKKLTDSALFVSISGNVDGVVWPNHYADISLKHPQKRFRPGGSIKCRVLVVDPVRKRVALTAKKTLLDSTLPIISKFEDAQVGLVTHAVVFKTSEKSLQVEFYNNIKAIVPAREASEAAVASLSNAFPVGKPVTVRIVSVDPESSRITASIRQASPTYKSAVTDISGVEIGNNVEGVIADIHKDKLVLTLQPTQVTALLSLNNLANRREVSVAQLRTKLKVGDKLQDLVVVSRNPEKSFVLVASSPKDKVAQVPKGSLSLDTVEVGQVVGGRVLRHIRQGALVKLTTSISGVLHPTDACDDYESGSPFPPVDSIIRAVIIAVNKEKRQLTLSTRSSRLRPDKKQVPADREIESLNALSPGDTVRGFIKSVAEHGLFVMLGRNIDARVQIKELFDDFVKDWKSRFTVNQLIKGRIVSVDHEKKQVEMSFRSGDITKSTSSRLSFAHLSEGQKVNGRVKKIEEYGLFIEIEGTKLSGLCHKSELSDNKDADVTLALRSFREGDPVKAKILSVDSEKRRISFGLKPSYFTEDDLEASGEDSALEDDSTSQAFGVIETSEDPASEAELESDEGEAEEDADSSDHDGSEADVVDMDVDINFQSTISEHPLAVNGASVPSTMPLSIKEGFQWSASGAQDEDAEMTSSSEDDEDQKATGKKRRKRKEIEQDLTADLHTKTPDSNADFERVLLGSPNSSYLWIQYMSFQLQLSEVDKAREVARRALRTISFREEQEKLNVWIALLNLENTYGTDESLESTFKDAARHNDSKTIHLRMAAIFEQSEKSEKAEEQFKKTCKKFGQSSKVWTLFADHYLRHGKLEEARQLLPRSLQSLEKRKHLKTISKFAQLEYKLGDPERGKTLFEGIIDSHPKRWDLWSIYMDMEASQGAIGNLRNLFNRVLALKMTSHKAKSFFKKWLDLERRLGDEEGAATVKVKAIEWTQRAANTA